MIVYAREKFTRAIKIDFVRFCIVGGLGFLINLIILTLLSHMLDFPIFASQIVGAEIALFSNFMLHHNWTYKTRKVNKSFKKLLWQFHATSWPAIIGSALMVSAGVKIIHLNELTALTVSSFIALIWNFIWSKYVVWRSITTDKIEEIIK